MDYQTYIQQYIIKNPPMSHTHNFCRKLAFKCYNLYPELTHKTLLECSKMTLNRLFKEFPAGKEALVRQRRINFALKLPDAWIIQGSQEWHNKRARTITGTLVYDIINTPGSRFSAMMKKLVPEPKITDLRDAIPSCRHGIIFEDIAKAYYEMIHGVQTKELSCINHREHPILGASPDGAVMTTNVPLDKLNEQHGRLIEIKCPISRVPKPDSIPEDYRHQMMLQMECMKINECDFIEFVFDNKSIGLMSEFIDTEVGGQSGTAVDNIAKGYFLMDADMSKKIGFKIYTTTEVDKIELRNLVRNPDIKVFYWTLKKYQRQIVKLDTSWLPTNIEKFYNFYNELEEHRKNSTLPEPPKELAEKRARRDNKMTIDFTNDMVQLAKDIKSPKKPRVNQFDFCHL